MIDPDARARADALHRLLAARDPSGAAWVEQSAAELGPDAGSLRLFIARAARMLSEEPVAPTDSESDALAAARVAISPAWVLRDLGRAVLVLRALAIVPATEHAPLVATLVRRGELGEQASMLRMLPVLPRPERFVDAAIDACRTNALPVFTAIALDNPFPATWFPDLHFDQMVLKAVFIGVPVERIHGLADRITETTVRMARDYAAERRAAGRPIPADVDRIVAIHEDKP